MQDTKNTVTLLGEFKDKNIEKDFFNKKINTNKNLIRYHIAFMGLILALITLYDILFEYHINTFYTLFLVRTFVIILSFLMFVAIDKINKVIYISTLVTVYYSIFNLSVVLLMFYYNQETILYQTMVVTLMTQTTFFVPNKLLNQIIVCLITITVFFITLPFQTIDIPVEIVVFFLLTMFNSMFFNAKINFNSRASYVYNNKISNLSEHDNLTNLYHRIKMEEAINFWSDLANRGESKFSVILYDIDKLGEINETKGTGAGNYVLQKSSEILSSIIRSHDVYGRWGDDEFLIIIPNADLKQAAAFAERIREKIHSFTFQQIDEITISVGVATYIRDEGSSSIINRVNTLVKCAKLRGSNIVVTEDNLM